MQFQADTGVFTEDGKKVGQVDRVVLDPQTKDVTHIVVRKGFLFKEDRVIPIDRVEAATAERVVLREGTDPLESYPVYQDTAYIRIPLRKPGRPEPGMGYPSSVYPYVPLGPLTMQESGIPATARQVDRMVDDVSRPNIPEGLVALKEGAKVISEDGAHVGNIERVYVHPEGGQITHLLLSQGVVFKDKKVIPVEWVWRVESEEVHLAVSAEVLAQVPEHRESDIPGGYV
jgi:uncharacterized protein YrrD